MSKTLDYINNELPSSKISENHLTAIRFVKKFTNDLKKTRPHLEKYGINESEVTILNIIHRNPGITASEIKDMWDCTASAISQVVKKLVEKGLVYKEQDWKIQKLYSTEIGGELADIDRQYSIEMRRKRDEAFYSKMTIEEHELFYKLLRLYADALDVF